MYSNCLVTDEDDCLADNGQQCIFPFADYYYSLDYTRHLYNSCYRGKCPTRLDYNAKAKEQRVCMPGCPGGDILSFYKKNV